MVIGIKEGENDVINKIKHLKIVAKIVIEKYSQKNSEKEKKRVLKRMISGSRQFIRYTILLLLPENRVYMTKTYHNHRPQVIPFAPTCIYEHCLLL